MGKATCCPVCDRQLGLFRWLAAPTPWHFRCPRCRCVLRLRRGVWFGTALAVAVGIVIGIRTGPWVTELIFDYGRIWSAVGLTLAVAIGSGLLYDAVAWFAITRWGGFVAKPPPVRAA